MYSKLVGGQSYLEKWFRLDPCWYHHHVKYDALAQINILVVNLPADPPEQCLEQTVELPVTLDVIMLMGRHSYGKGSGIAQMKRGVVICSGGWMHYNDVIMGPIASQITSFTIVYSIVYSDTDQRKHQSSSSLAFVRGIHRGPVNSPHKWPVTLKMFTFDDVIMGQDSTDRLFNFPSLFPLEGTQITVKSLI